MSQKNDQISEKILSDLLMNFDNAESAKQPPIKADAEKATESKTPQTPKSEATKNTETNKAKASRDSALQNTDKQAEQKNVPKKKASKNANTPSQKPSVTDLSKEAPKKETSSERITISEPAKELQAPVKGDSKKKASSSAVRDATTDPYWDVLSFSNDKAKEQPASQKSFEATKFSLADSAELKTAKKEAVADGNSAKNKTEEKETKTKKTKKTKKSLNLVEIGVRISERNEHAKLIFIISMILLAPFALLIALSVLLLFAVAIVATLLATGIMSIAVLGVVVVGVLLSLVGVAYGAINLLTSEGFAVAVGQYELGLGIAIAGITIVVSALLYSGITDLVPFLFKKMGQLFKFLAKKTKKLIVWLYKYSTQL